MSRSDTDTTTPFTDGSWKITTLKYGMSNRSYSYIEHHCERDYNAEEVDVQRWRHLNYKIEGRGDPCEYCNEAPPEGLQACFWFLKSNEPFRP
jgi:hypothetical protein